MSEVCTDNRFEIIAKAKADLLESTNIETSEDEMACLDSFLLRCWQMGWLKKYEEEERKWIPCSERMPEDLEEVNITWVNHDPEPYYNFAKDKPSTATAVYYEEKWYWYSSTCADYLAEYGQNRYEEIDDGIEIIAWMPLPKPWKGETDG